MSGLLALLDDVAALARLAATQIDDVAAQATKAGAKAAGVVIDDSAVTPRYVHGLPAAREIPIVLQIARGSLFNKLVILLPAALLLSAVAPGLLAPLLMLGGAYLCFEGAEKVWHMLRPHAEHHPAAAPALDAVHLERERVQGAIKTDFILSAEIMAITLAAVDAPELWKQAVVLAVVAVGITGLVYGSVAVLVKADDVGLRMSAIEDSRLRRRLGQGIVHAMPRVLTALAAVGTLAMLWVGGSIILHGLEELGWPAPAHAVHEWAVATAHALPLPEGLTEWFVTASLDGILGLLLGLLLIPVGTRVVAPLVRRLKGGNHEGGHEGGAGGDLPAAPTDPR